MTTANSGCMLAGASGDRRVIVGWSTAIRSLIPKVINDNRAAASLGHNSPGETASERSSSPVLPWWYELDHYAPNRHDAGSISSIMTPKERPRMEAAPEVRRANQVSGCEGLRGSTARNKARAEAQ
jgi:hypothetical protein